jgi:hypothetical protein
MFKGGKRMREGERTGARVCVREQTESNHHQDDEYGRGKEPRVRGETPLRTGRLDQRSSGSNNVTMHRSRRVVSADLRIVDNG